jgi:hypothetical protein
MNQQICGRKRGLPTYDRMHIMIAASEALALGSCRCQLNRLERGAQVVHNGCTGMKRHGVGCGEDGFGKVHGGGSNSLGFAPD